MAGSVNVLSCRGVLASRFRAGAGLDSALIEWMKSCVKTFIVYFGLVTLVLATVHLSKAQAEEFQRFPSANVRLQLQSKIDQERQMSQRYASNGGSFSRVSPSSTDSSWNGSFLHLHFTYSQVSPGVVIEEDYLLGSDNGAEPKIEMFEYTVRREDGTYRSIYFNLKLGQRIVTSGQKFKSGKALVTSYRIDRWWAPESAYIVSDFPRQEILENNAKSKSWHLSELF